MAISESLNIIQYIALSLYYLKMIYDSIRNGV